DFASTKPLIRGKPGAIASGHDWRAPNFEAWPIQPDIPTAGNASTRSGRSFARARTGERLELAVPSCGRPATEAPGSRSGVPSERIRRSHVTVDELDPTELGNVLLRLP